MSGDNRKQQNGFIRAFSLLSQIGITIIVCIGISIFLGFQLDKLLGTTPWLLVVFIFLGIAAAFKSIFDFAKRL